MDMNELNAALEKYLRVETFPLGIRPVKEESEIPDKAKVPSKDMRVKLAICQGISIARRYGWTMAMGGEDISCPIAKAVFGFEERIDYYQDGHLAKALYSEDLAGGRKMEEALDKYDYEEYSHILVGPLSRINYVPETILVYGNSAQVLRLVNASLYREGGSLTSHFSGRGDCSDIIIRGGKGKMPQVVLPCYGDRIFGMTSDHEMAFTFPVDMAEEIVTGLEKTHRLGVRYPIPQYLRFEAKYPPPYQELERMWRKE